MSKGLGRRLDVLEQKSMPTNSELENNGLVWILSYGLLPHAVNLVEHKQLGEVHELVRYATQAAGMDLSEAKVDWCVQRLANNLSVYKADVERGARIREESIGAGERQLRADAAFLARNRRQCGWQEGPQTDEAAIYAELAARAGGIHA